MSEFQTSQHRSERSSCCAVRRLRGQFRIDQGFHLAPNFWIAFDFGVGSDQDPVAPGISVAANRICFIVESVIANDLGPCRIGSANPGPPVHNSVRLVEIDGLLHIGGNYSLILSPPWGP